MNAQTLFSHRDSGHLPAELKITNRADSYSIEFRNEGGGGSDQQWQSVAFGRSVIASMVTALTANLESLPPTGTFACPICTVDSIHTHSGEEVAEYRIAAGAPADPDALQFNAQRLRNVAHLVGLQGAIPVDDASLDGARGAVLGQIAGKLRAAGAPADTPKPDALARMAHDFPALQAFHEKHALGPMLAPSCLCCGQQTHPLTRPVVIKHGELPGIVVCAVCRDSAQASPAATIGAGEGKDALDAARWRYVRDSETLETAVWEALEGTDCAPGGVFDRAAYAAGMDKAVDAAMRSKTSPGEAG